MPSRLQRQAVRTAPFRGLRRALLCAAAAFGGLAFATDAPEPSPAAGEPPAAAAASPDAPDESGPAAAPAGLVPGPLAEGASPPESAAATASPASGAEGLEARELGAALEHALRENAELRRLVEAAEAQRRILVESLSEAVRVSEEQVALSRELRLKVEAYGVDLFSGDETGLRERLLKAVRDLDISRQEEARRGAALQRLSETFLSYLAATADAPAPQRAAAEAAVREAGEALVDLVEAGADPASGRPRVVSVDPEIGLVVFDSGRRSGLRVGTPVAVLRGERPIFSAMVVDVRQSIAGAVLQERLAEGEEVAVGDGVELLPTDAEL